MKIRTKLIVAFGVVALMTLSVSVLGFLQTRILSSALYEIGVVRLPSIEGLDEMKSAMMELDSLADERLNVTEIPADIPAREKKALEELQQGWDLYEPLPQSKEESVKWEAFVAAVNRWKAITDFKNPAKADQLAIAMRLLDELISVNNEIVKHEKVRTIASFQDSVRVQRNMLAASILALAIAIGVGLLMGREITRPLSAIQRSLSKIGAGDLQSRIESKSNDELGDVARATNRLAEELSNSESRLKLLSDNLPADMVYQFELQADGQSRFTYVSAGVERLHGIRAEEFVRRPDAIYEQVVEEDRPALRRAREQSLSAMTPFEAIVRVRRKDGEVRWMHLSSAPRRLPDGRVIWDGVERDVTAIKLAQEEVQWRKAFLEAQVHSSPDGILVVDQRGRKILQNQRLIELWGIPPSIANDPENDAQLQFFATQVKQSADFLDRVKHLQGHPNEIGHDEVELENGTVLDRYSAPVLDEAGAHYGRIWTFRDITERKQTEEQIQLCHTLTMDIARAENLQAAFEIVLRRLCERSGWAVGHAWVLDPDGKELRIAASWVRDEPALKELSRISQNLRFKRGVSLPGMVWDSGRPLWVPDVQHHPVFPTSVRREAGLRAGIRASLDVPIISDGEVIAVLEFGMTRVCAEDRRLTDLTSVVATQIGLVIQRKRAEEMLHLSHQRLRALAGRLQVVREEERTRIAREIHDILAQELTRLKIDLDWLRKHVSSAGATEESKSFTEKLDASIDLANTATVTVQKIAAELRPVVLDSLGLAAAIEWQAEEIQRRTGIQCDVIVTDDDFRMNHQAETNIFRIIQESLTNVVRHANATKVEIIMERNDNRLVLIVQDNGVGFDCGNLKDPNSLGLLGMRERALMMNGEFEIHGEPGKGTQVKAAFPLNEPGANPRNVL